MPNSASLSTEVSASAPAIERRDGGVTGRVVILSLLLAALFGYMIPLVDFKVRNTKLGSGHLPIGAVGVLLVLLLLINPLLKKLRSSWSFTRNEVLTVYITTLFSTLVPGMGSENLFVSYIIAPFYFATRENKWLEFLQPYLKPWFTPALSAQGVYGPAQHDAVNGWYNGATPGLTGAVVPWGVWLVPLLMWGSLVFASYIMLGTLSVMLRAQWGEREALAFPLLKLPMEMTEDVDAQNRVNVRKFFSNPGLWIGFGIAVFIEGMNGLNVYFPDVPFVPLSFPLSSLFTETPWNQMAPMALLCFPIFVAITFLLTTEVSLIAVAVSVDFPVPIYRGLLARFSLRNSAARRRPFGRRRGAHLHGVSAGRRLSGLRRDFDVDGARAFQNYRSARLWSAPRATRGSRRAAFLSGRVLGFRAVVRLHYRLELPGRDAR